MSRFPWYRAYTCYGRASQVIEDISRFVRNAGLTDTVVALRVERQPSKEFSLFLKLETDQWGELPDELAELLARCSHLRSPLPAVLTLPEIQGMASGDMQVKTLGRCLEYRRIVREAYEDPFTTEAHVLQRDADYPPDAAERLLWFLSASGSGPWSTFRAACAALGILEAGLASRLARHLRLLGHLEMQPGGRWVVAPTTVVEVTTTSAAQRFLAGARDSTTPWTRREDQPGGPPRLEPSDDTDASVVVDPAQRLADLLPDAVGHRAALPTIGGVNPVALRFRRFDGLHFAACSFTGEDGLYELTSPEQQRYALHVGGRWLSGEFFTLRFHALVLAGLLGPWRYHADSMELAVRYEERPPELYERALVLCSGRLPAARGNWLTYNAVPQDLAAQLADRLGLRLDGA